MAPCRPSNWEYFAAVEADLAACERYVEFAPANFGTYSNEFAKIIVTAGSEIDAVLRRMCSLIDPARKPRNILEYYPIVASKYPHFVSSKVDIRHKRLTFAPWESWTEIASPNWWKAGFNVVKHDRTQNFSAARLENALCAVGALFMAIICCHHAETGAPVHVDFNRGTRLFTPAKCPTDQSGAYWYYAI